MQSSPSHESQTAGPAYRAAVPDVITEQGPGGLKIVLGGDRDRAVHRFGARLNQQHVVDRPSEGGVIGGGGEEVGVALAERKIVELQGPDILTAQPHTDSGAEARPAVGADGAVAFQHAGRPRTPVLTSGGSFIPLVHHIR